MQRLAAGFNHSVALGHFTRPARAARPCVAKKLRVSAQATQSADPDVVDSNVNPYCSIDASGRRPLKELTMGEKENLFLDALSSYYYGSKPVLSNEEFDNLKEELTWEGSKVVVLSEDETLLLEAQRGFSNGQPIMSDTEYDALKLRLKQSNSVVTQQGPRCSLETKALLADAEVDYFKMVALNVPPALIVLGALFSIDDLTGLAPITQLVRLPEPYGLVLLWGGLLPVVYVLANALANFFFKDALILKGRCPNCNTENYTYFGDILTVAGNRDRNTLTCSGCEAKLVFDALTREVELIEMPQEKSKAPAKPKKE